MASLSLHLHVFDYYRGEHFLLLLLAAGTSPFGKLFIHALVHLPSGKLVFFLSICDLHSNTL